MRLSRIALPLSAALVLAGLAMYLSAKPNQNQGYAIDFDQPTHPVTPTMVAEADKSSRKPAPKFRLSDVKGEEHSIAGKQDRPQFLLFILDTCPCSIDAQPIFNSFSKHWEGKVDFLGIINVDAQKGRSWSSDFRPKFPILADPKLSVSRAYGAKQSVYGVLISAEGSIVKLWPGYSASMMEEMNEQMAAELGEKVRPFDTQYAPKEKTSGCFFES